MKCTITSSIFVGETANGPVQWVVTKHVYSTGFCCGKLNQLRHTNFALLFHTNPQNATNHIRRSDGGHNIVIILFHLTKRDGTAQKRTQIRSQLTNSGNRKRHPTLVNRWTVSPVYRPLPMRAQDKNVCEIK